MAPEKGVREAILASRKAGLRLKIAARLSEEHECAYFRRDVEPLIDGRDIEFLGELSRADALALLRNAAVMVNPIAWPEPFGTVMVESLASGTPVVAFRRGSVEEIIEHGVTGAVCTTLDEVVAGLRNYATFDRSACRKAAEINFSNERVVDEHVAFYLSVLERRR
jgi:glycosyltransferase involved in cell wall biosynthesis